MLVCLTMEDQVAENMLIQKVAHEHRRGAVSLQRDSDAGTLSTQPKGPSRRHSILPSLCRDLTPASFLGAPKGISGSSPRKLNAWGAECRVPAYAGMTEKREITLPSPRRSSRRRCRPCPPSNPPWACRARSRSRPRCHRRRSGRVHWHWGRTRRCSGRGRRPCP